MTFVRNSIRGFAVAIAFLSLRAVADDGRRDAAADALDPALLRADYEKRVEGRKAALRALDAERDAAERAWAAEAPDSRFAAHCVKADRESGEVVLRAFTTELTPGAIAEFVLVTLNSGHEYEAVFQTEATATDLEKALGLAGMRPGRPVEQSKFRFWPRGERVFATASVAGAAPLPLESFMADANTREPWPVSGFVHCGGAAGDGGTNKVDYAGPGSLVSSYNEPLTIFDVPRLAEQSDVYESVIASTNVPGEGWLPVELVFRAESRPANLPQRRVRDVSLRIAADGSFALDGEAGAAPADAVEKLRGMVSRDALDPFISVSWDDDCSIAGLRASAQLLFLLERSGTGVRVDAPPPGFPFYRAFLPPDEWRERASRYTQPCELRFDEGGAATLVAIREVWTDDKLAPDLDVSEFPVPSADALPALLAAHSPETPKALLVFAPGATKWRGVAPFLERASATHPLLQIFVE